MKNAKNVFLFVEAGTSFTQVVALLKEKASFLQKNEKFLFRKEFTDNLAETIIALAEIH